MKLPFSTPWLPLVGVALAVAGGCGEVPEAEEEGAHAPSADPAELMESARSAFGTVEPVPEERLEDPEVVLGRELFWDERLSADGRTACASCHTREAWGADDRRLSPDARGELTSRQSHTVLNSTLQPTIRWRGDREDAAHQAFESITGSMGFDAPEEIVPVLEEHGYDEGFREAFPEESAPVSPDHYARALEAYQETLITPAPFDEFLDGDLEALTEEQMAGLETFQASGCTTCHNQELLGGTTLQRFGVVEDYWEATGSEEIDEGRYAITGEEEDRYVFRTSMLRNVARTAPYFHDGSVESLEEAVRVMARVQLGRTLSDSEVDRIVAFLESLTGDLPEHFAPPDG